jgi:K+ transporter
MNIARVNIEFSTGCEKIKQRRISFVLGYLRMILWKFLTAISIKYRILATFNIKKINSDSLYAFKVSNMQISN